MRLRRVRLQSLRNHRDTEIECAPRTNIFTGANGQGKTTILEAVSICALTRSFVPLPRGADANLAAQGLERYFIEAEFVADSGRAMRIAVEYGAQPQKRFVVDGAPVRSYARHIGTIPVIAASPDDRGITMGAPQERRDMLDMLISQSRRAYLEELISYRKIFRQRNALLAQAQHRRLAAGEREELAAWSEALCRPAAAIFWHRRNFINIFHEYVSMAYRLLGTESEIADITYQPNIEAGAGATLDDWRNATAGALAAREQEELLRGTTLAGPHRDDVVVTMNGVEARQNASQGQHKTLLGALKLAAWRYLNDALHERPLFLFDDLFSELDASRAKRYIGAIQECGQALITCTSVPVALAHIFAADGAQDALWVVRNGEAAKREHARTTLV